MASKSSSTEDGWRKLSTLSEYSDTSVKNIRKWMGEGLPFSKIGGLIFIKMSNFEKWMKSHEVK